jgi:hypothetical protein
MADVPRHRGCEATLSSIQFTDARYEGDARCPDATQRRLPKDVDITLALPTTGDKDAGCGPNPGRLWRWG